MASEGQKRNKKKKKKLSSPFLELNPAVGRGRADFEKWRVFRERKCNFSLNFLAFRPSVLVGPRSKVVLRCKGYARRHWFCGVSTTPRGRGLLLLGYFRF